MSQKERERLKVLHEVQRGHLTQVEAGWRLKLSPRQVRRVLRRLEAEGDGGLIHRMRGRRSNRKFSEQFQRRVLSKVRRRYADFGPTLASEHLVGDGLELNRETLTSVDERSRSMASTSASAQGGAHVASETGELW